MIRGLDGDDTLYGYDGNDTLDGGAGNDALYGSTGDDSYIVGGDDTIEDSGGADRLFLPTGIVAAGLTATRDGNGRLTIAWSGGSATIGNALDIDHAVETLVFSNGTTLALAGLRFETLGTGNDDSLGGNTEELGSRDDVIRGLDGNDTLYGYDGNDTLDGGPGNDTLYGGVGADRYIVLGNDVVQDIGATGDGDDTIVLPSGVTAAALTLTRDAGGDLLLAWADGSVRIAGGLDPRYAVERIEFANGTGIALTSLPFVTLGTNGDNALYGNQKALGSHDDVIRGLDGNDTLYGYDGNDTLDGGANDDQLYGGAGSDTYIVGGGDNFVSESGSTGDAADAIVLPDDVTPAAVRAVRLADGDIKLSWAGGSVRIDNAYDPRYAIEQVRFHDGTVWQLATQRLATTGSGENETLYGNTLAFGSHDDVILGLDGTDTLYGQDGNDTLDGGAGNDAVYGGLGDDSYVASPGLDLFSESGGGGTDVIRFAADIRLPDLVFTPLADASLEIDWRDGAIVIDRQLRGGTYAIESLQIGSGAPVSLQALANLSVSGAAVSPAGDAQANVLLGNGDANELHGGGGNDVLLGGGGNDLLFGEGDDDQLAGGAGDDVLRGGAGIDRLTGGAGNDVFRGTIAELNGDTITDLAAGDRIHLTDAGVLTAFSRTGATLTFTGGSLTLANAPAGHVLASADPLGGLDIALVARGVADDFDGDGRSDILWREAGGALTDFLSTDGGFAGNDGAYGVVSVDWKIAGTGDFNGDGRDDILWRNDGGALTDWLSTGRAWAGNDAAYAVVSTDWKIAGTGDFNGDGRDDILWRNDNGALTDWLSTGTGWAGNDAAYAVVGTSWKIVGTGDFNGDGRDDILWRNDNGALTDWLSTGTGWAGNDAAYAVVGTGWKIAGTGDFNGDGRDDLLWRNDNGALTSWLSTGTGWAGNDAAYAVVGTDWKVAGTADYNGDGRDDILWRNDNGALTDWLSTGTGWAGNDAAFGVIGTSWHLQAHDHLAG